MKQNMLFMLANLRPEAAEDEGVVVEAFPVADAIGQIMQLLPSSPNDRQPHSVALGNISPPL